MGTTRTSINAANIAQVEVNVQGSDDTENMRVAVEVNDHNNDNKENTI